MPLTNDLLSNFTNLEVIGVNPINSRGDSFTGDGLRKYIGPEGFPYDLFRYNTKLKEIVAFFQGSDFTDLTAPLGLPGDLFKYNTELVKTERLFYNMNINPDKSTCVLTGGSFENCINLKEVPYMFGCDTTGKINAFMGSEIPAKLFYHGGSEVTKTIRGCNIDRIIEGCTYVSNGNKWSNGDYTYSGTLTVIDKNSGKIQINPATTIMNGTNKESLVSESDIEEVIFTYFQPNTNITNMEGCFQGGDWSEYGNSDDFSYSDNPDVNENYSPYKYIINNGVWSVNANYSPYAKTYMWQYNGDWELYDDFIKSKGFNKDELEMLDDAYGCTIENKRISRTLGQNLGQGVNASLYPNLEMDMSVNGNATTLELSGKFICAPDLLKYCNTNPNVENLFNYCGPKAHLYSKSDKLRYGDNAPTLFYGLKGRLVPYLLKPVPKLSSLKNMFTYCKFISSYIKSDSVYPIPESFVQYLTYPTVNFTRTFAGWYFPAKTNLDVFKVSRNVTYTLDSTFEHPLFSNRICTSKDITKDDYIDYPATQVYGIFNDGTGYTKAGNIRGVFCTQEARSTEEKSTNTVRNQSVQFSGVFAQGSYTGGTDEYCFAGYTDPKKENSSWSDRFLSKSVNQSSDSRNYVVYSGPGLS